MSKKVAENWTPDTMTEKLKSGVVCFSFERADGEIREALGTLSPKLLPKRDEAARELAYEIAKIEFMDGESAPTEMLNSFRASIASLEERTERKKKEGVVSYFDLQKGAFRSIS